MQEYDIKAIMEEIEQDLIVRMKRTLWSHKEDEKTKGFNWPQWQALKLKQFQEYRDVNKRLFNKKTKALNRYLYKHMKKQFKEGAARINKEAIKVGIIKREDSQLGGSFFGLNHRKLDALIKSTKEDMKDVKYATLRMANDQYRQIIFKAQVYANTGAGTVKQAIDMATKDFLAKGFNCIEYKDGSRHNIADYCDMVIRTANKRASLMGEGEMRKKLGNSLVYISKHGGACDKCTPWEGRVYIDNVWSGGTEKDGKYPMLSTAIESGLFHPRCQHGSSTYYEGINNEPKEVTQAKHNHNKEDKYAQYLQQRQKQYERLAIGSLLPENALNYQKKANELQNQIESSKIVLSNEEQYAINQYISSESYILNEILRKELKLTEQQKVFINNLDKALDKFPKYEGNVTRSILLDEDTLKDFLENHKSKNNVIYKAYTSTTAGNRYNNDSNVELHIKSKSGKDIRRFNKEEQEILFKRNTKFQIINSKIINNTYHIFMEEI